MSFAFALRMAAMLVLHSYRIGAGEDHFEFGWEMGRVARCLAQGQGFASPMPEPTGPTAIVGPLYPLLIAAVFKLFGIYSSASAVVILVLQSVFSSLTCLFIYLCGRDTVGEMAGKLSALCWAVFPLNVFFTLTRVWETAITAMFVAALFWYMLRLRQSLSIWRWAGAGALAGVAGLINTSLVVLVVPFGVWALLRSRVRLMPPIVVALLTCLAVVWPWLARNHAEFGKFMLRSNFAMEFRVGNNELSPGQKVEALHPANTPYLNQHWRQLGESRFMVEESKFNSRFVAANPGWFTLAIVNRMVNYWTGAWIVPTADFPNNWLVIVPTSILSMLGLLGVRRMFYDHNPAALMYAGCLLIYPVVYYLTTSQPRFYHAIAPLLIVPAAFWVLQLSNKVAAPGADSSSSLPETPVHRGAHAREGGAPSGTPFDLA
jgi:4-amino-4-deoxy-L-arabinose transferase-like glycosyltransferase